MGLISTALPDLAATAAAATATVVKDQGSAGVAFFNNLRVPAALVAAAAIKDAFVLQSAPKDIEHSRAWTLLRNSYLLLMMIAFTSEVSTIFIATHAMTQLQTSKTNTAAESVVALLIRELEFELVGCRCQFVTGLLAFVLAQGLRLRLVFRRHAALAKASLCFLISTAFGLLTYHNAHSITYGGYSGLVRRWGQLSSRMLVLRVSPRRPAALVALATALASLLYAVAQVHEAYQPNPRQVHDTLLQDACQP